MAPLFVPTRPAHPAPAEPPATPGDRGAPASLPAVVPLPQVAPAAEPPDPTVSPDREHEPDLDPDTGAEPAGWRARRRARKAARQARREERMLHRRYRIFPRTVIGISAMLLVAAIAAGATGAVLYAYYDWRLTQNEDRVGDLARGLEGRLEDANTNIENETNEAINQVREETEALTALVEDQNRIVELLPEISPSVWLVSTLDDSGRPATGSAFVVSGDGGGSLLLTSYATVAASTVDPAPEITLRKGEDTMVASLYSWDPERDLALLTVDRPDMEPLAWANEEERAEAAGKRGYAVTGLGGAEATLSPGQVLDLTAAEVQHSIPISEHYQGGPILTPAGKVLAVASLEYQPLNFESTGSVTFGVPVGLACERVLTCNGGAPG